MTDLEFEQREVADLWRQKIVEEIRHTENSFKVKECEVESYKERLERLREDEAALEARYKELRCQEVTGMSAREFYHQTVVDMGKCDMQAIEDAKAEKIAALEKENQAEDSLQL